MSASKVCSRCLRAGRTRPVPSLHSQSLLARQPLQRAPLQASARSKFSTSTRRLESKSLEVRPRASKGRSRKPWIYSLASVVLAGAAWYTLGSESSDDTLNTTKFTPFNIISKEQVSPTAFILTIRCPDNVKSKNSAKIKAAWDHGLWSVEMKQPQLQIARHYTPLPPLDDAGVDTGNLRFLIRKMDTGEMSNYLFRLQVGDQVWLRGPHYGFDVLKRMGDAKDVVFLAGGTGIAPALQLAHKLFNGNGDATGSRNASIRILWANRRSVDSLGRGELSVKSKTTAGNTTTLDSLTTQILDFSRTYGDSFKIDYFVDDEKFIALKDVNAAMGNTLFSRKQPSFAATDKRCRWHSHEGLAATLDEDDKAAADASCVCRPHNMPPEPIGRNLLGISGPDGFIEAYSGPKRWFGGREIQGPVLGLLGSMKRMDPKMDDWLVLKL
ncbi:oxidoreductase FAD-binding domain-containing protein [Seiridium cupressi]